MKKLIIQSKEILYLVPHAEISYCRSDNCYTCIFLNDGRELIMCRSLKKVSEELDSGSFIRVNQSYLVNKESIKLIDKKNKVIELVDSKRIPFSINITDLISHLK